MDSAIHRVQACGLDFTNALDPRGWHMGSPKTPLPQALGQPVRWGRDTKSSGSISRKLRRKGDPCFSLEAPYSVLYQPPHSAVPVPAILCLNATRCLIERRHHGSSKGRLGCTAHQGLPSWQQGCGDGRPSQGSERPVRPACRAFVPGAGRLHMLARQISSCPRGTMQ